jgi:hypothetical protein
VIGTSARFTSKVESNVDCKEIVQRENCLLVRSTSPQFNAVNTYHVSYANDTLKIEPAR